MGRGPAYWLPERPAPAEAALLGPADLPRFQAHFPDFLQRPWESRLGPVAASLVGGQAVALCTCARWTESVAEAGVHTAPAFRGQGHARAAVLRWAQEVRRLGRIPLYSTAWENVASQRLAASLGGVWYGEDWSLY